MRFDGKGKLLDSVLQQDDFLLSSRIDLEYMSNGAPSLRGPSFVRSTNLRSDHVVQGSPRHIFFPVTESGRLRSDQGHSSLQLRRRVTIAVTPSVFGRPYIVGSKLLRCSSRRHIELTHCETILKSSLKHDWSSQRLLRPSHLLTQGGTVSISIVSLLSIGFGAPTSPWKKSGRVVLPHAGCSYTLFCVLLESSWITLRHSEFTMKWSASSSCSSLQALLNCTVSTSWSFGVSALLLKRSARRAENRVWANILQHAVLSASPLSGEKLSTLTSSRCMIAENSTSCCNREALDSTLGSGD